MSQQGRAPIILNLGCSDDLMEGAINVDIVAPPNAMPDNFQAWDLAEPWPWRDSSIDKIYAHDVFEHVDTVEFRGNAGMIWTFNESWRVLKPGGLLRLIVPCLPGSAPFVDPTHKVVYHSDNRFYFDERWNHPKGERGRLGPAYGIAAVFRTLPSSRSGVDWKPVNYAPGTDRHKLFLALEAVKA